MSSMDFARRVLLAVAVATLCSCSSTAGTSVDESDPVFEELIQNALVNAEAGGASQDQLDVLQAAQLSGEVTLEQARQAARATVACFGEAGLLGTFVESTEPSGLIVPGYTVGTQSDDMTEIDRCDHENGFWVNQVYQLQPSSEQLRTDLFEAKADELRACLEDAGYATEPDATGAELARQASAVAADTSGEVDCMTIVGQ